MSKIRLILFNVAFLSVFSSSYCHANEININVGVMTFAFIPVLAGDLEYEIGNYAIRANYYSTFGFNLFGSSVYKGKAVEFAYRVNEKDEKIYLSIGSGTKREGTTEDEDHRFYGVGYEVDFGKESSDDNPGEAFVRLYAHMIEFEYVEDPEAAKDKLPLVGIMGGIRF